MSGPAYNLDQVIEGVTSILTLEKMMGNQTVELDPETVGLLRKTKKTTRSAPAHSTPKALAHLPPTQAQTTQATPTPTPQRGNKAERLAVIAENIHVSDSCGLKASATQAVPGHGNPNADLVILGEAPGREEDEQGLPFVGESGHVLDRLLAKAGIPREDVWIGNIVKWRPPNNRTPTLDEIQACLPFLEEQIAVIEPRVILCLGGVAAKALLQTPSGIMRLRGIWHEFNSIPVMPTYHPAYLQRCEGAKRKMAYQEVWSDTQEVLKKLGLPVPK